jgi:hypothetical protein
VTWALVNLADVAAVEAPKPRWAGIAYPGQRHLWSGEPESAKSLAADIVLLEVLRSGGGAILIDLEMGATARRARLVDLGATVDELAALVYLEPDTAPTAADLNTVLAALAGPADQSVAVIDAAATAFSLSGLDDHARADVETFAAQWVSPLRAAGVATILIDHVAKAREGRGRFAFGSERKVGAVDVHLGFDAIAPFARGGHGLVRITTHKDRTGHLRRPVAAELELHSDPDSHRISWTWKRADRDSHPDENGWRPTILMGRVHTHVARHAEGRSMNQILTAGLGKSKDTIRLAVDRLLLEGYLHETTGGRGARVFHVARDFAPTSPGTPQTTSPDLAPTSPGEVRASSPDLASPLQGARTEARSATDATSPGEVERLAALGDQLGLTDPEPDPFAGSPRGR